MSKTNFISQLINYKLLIIIQAIASIILAFFVYQLDILPNLYLFIIIAILLLLVVMTFLLMKSKGKYKRYSGKILSILLSIVMIIGSLYIVKGSDVLESITGANKKINNFYVYVLNDSEYNKLDDLSYKFIGMSQLLEEDDIKLENAKNSLLNQNSHIRIEMYEDYLALVEDLYNGKIEAIYIDEAYISLIEEVYETFSEDIRILWNYEMIEEVVSITKTTDVTDNVFTIYISGIDTRGKVATVSRSDVNMLVTVNPVTKDILMTSIPRDYYVTLANKGKEDKLTHAGLGGVENSVKTLENLMNIDINYYAKVNFTSMEQIVDALGGITVYSPYNFVTRHEKIQIHKGENKLNGMEALEFVRERKTLPHGDVDRVKNQQRALKAMLNKAMSPAIITNYTKVLEAIDGSFETNMTSDEILQLIQMQLSDNAQWNFHQIVLSGTGKSMTGGAYVPNVKLYYKIPDQESVDYAASLIQQMVNGEKIDIPEEE